MTEHAHQRHSPSVAFANVHAVPALHGRLRFAGLVRRAFHAVRPDAIAVELPATLEPTIRQGVERLPYLSVVAYADYDEAIEKVRQILPVTPEDALMEAVRLGLEHGLPVRFIDRDVVGHHPEPIEVPDDYLLERIGLEAYWRTVTAELAPEPPGSPDDEREREMAAHLRDLAATHRRVLFVCGMAHLAPMMRHFEAGATVPPGGVTQREASLYNLSRESVPFALGSTPYYVYAYELARRGLQPADYPGLVPLPNTKGGELTAAEDAWRETHERLLADLRRRPTGEGDVDEFALLGDLVRGAVRLYDREWGEQPAPSRVNTLLRFARNLALVHRRLTPSKYEVVLAGKNTVNDDYAFQLLRLAEHYPFYEEDSELPEMKIEGEEEGEADGEKLVLRLRLPRSMQQEAIDPNDLDLEEPAEEAEPGAWEERWEAGEHHVSHLPQDIRLEDFFEYLRNRCRRIIADQQVRLHELQASLMDGLDLRETLRNMPMGKIYVREQLPAIGDVGPVVVIFHKPGEEHDYPHEMNWFAEHEGESDLALYSTAPGDHFDGPGISRCRYGGVLSLYPPTGRAYVWGNPRYEGRHSRAETLLKAAIDLSKKPVVAYAAPQGPSPEMQGFANARGIQLMYIPLDTLSADLLKRVRTFHVLADRYIRPLAHLYIKR